MLVSPAGDVLAALGPEGAGVAAAALERTLREEVREAMPLKSLAREEADRDPEAPGR